MSFRLPDHIEERWAAIEQFLRQLDVDVKRLWQQVPHTPWHHVGQPSAGGTDPIVPFCAPPSICDEPPSGSGSGSEESLPSDGPLSSSEPDESSITDEPLSSSSSSEESSEVSSLSMTDTPSETEPPSGSLSFHPPELSSSVGEKSSLESDGPISSSKPEESSGSDSASSGSKPSGSSGSESSGSQSGTGSSASSDSSSSEDSSSEDSSGSESLSDGPRSSEDESIWIPPGSGSEGGSGHEESRTMEGSLSDGDGESSSSSSSSSSRGSSSEDSSSSSSSSSSSEDDGGGGDDDVVVGCCPNGLPETLTASVAGSDSCPGVGGQIELKWNGTLWAGTGDIGGGPILLELDCFGGTCDAFELRSDCGITPSTPEAGCSCTPLNLVFKSMFLICGGCDFGAPIVTVTE